MNQFEQSGSQDGKQHKAVPLATTQIFTGYWPNSSPYRDAAVAFLYAKFYGATRNDKIAAGLNTEISQRMTLVRRPGTTVWNSNNFTNVTGFYSFRPFQAGVGEQVLVIVDTATAVYIGAVNGTPVKTLLYTKTAGAGKSRFKGAGTTLYWGDGLVTKKWSWFPSWQSTNSYTPGTSILDTNNNIQQALGYGVQISSTSVTSNVCTVNYTGSGVIQKGDLVTLYGLSTKTSLNGTTQSVISAGAGSFTITYVTADYGTTSDTGVVVDSTQGNGTSGGLTPSFSGTIQSTLLDGTVVWMSWGNSVQNMGIVAPTAPPGVQIVSVPAEPNWAANTYYWPTPLIFDSGTTSLQLLTTSGTTAGSPPSFSGTAGTTTTDGTAVWTSQGTATRATNHSYSLGSYIMVSWTYVYYTYQVTCFGGDSQVLTPAGYVRFRELPEKFWVVNETGKHLAELVVNENYEGEMIEYAPGKLVTPQHRMKRANKWIPAAEFYADKPRVPCQGKIYNLHVITENEEDRHFIIENGDVAHNISQIEGDGEGCTQVIKTPHDVTYTCYFKCTTAGVSSATATGSISWAAALNGTTVDGTVTWTNVGREVTRLGASTTSPTGGGTSNMVAGNVNNSVIVSANTEIEDSNGKGEVPTLAGISGGSAPTWATSTGAFTTEASGLTWSNQGQLGSANTGNWFYTFTYVNAATNDESTAAPLSQSILLPAASGVVVSGPGSSDTQVGAINIYRTTQQPLAATSGTPFLLTQIIAPPNGQSWTFTDTTTDPPNPGAILDVFITAPGFALVDGVVSNLNDPPPAGLTNLEFHAGRMWGTVGNIAYYSTGPDVTSGNGNTSWNVLNFFETPGNMYRLWPTTLGLFVLTNDGLWITQGLGTQSNPFQQIQEIDPNLSIISYDAFAKNGTQALVYTTDRLFLSMDPQNGTSWLGQPVATDLTSGYAPASVYVTYHGNGTDQRGFITNGSNQWLNYMQVPAPETGYLWNPPATISAGAGGVGAVTSVATSPGVYTLLIGPSGTGPILQRDSTLTTFMDNGTAYDAWAAFGNIVMAHHGQMAGLIHVGADFIKVGSKPTAWILLDEILNQPGTPNFTQITNPILDPPNLPASNTLYQLRYWMIETEEPCYCRNAIVKFDFGTDTVQNELLTFTLFGESLSEEG